MERKDLYKIFEDPNKDDKKSIFVQWFITILIFLNIIAIIIDSFDNTNENITILLYWFEVFSIVVFTIEYILRLISSPEKYKKGNYSYFIFIFSFMGLIDLLSILPFYFSFLIVLDLRFLRVFRLLRIFKLFRHFKALDTLSNVIKNEKNKLIMAFSILLILLVFSSSAMYYIENHYQPDKFTNIVSTFWWAVATLTTIGYGDVYPITGIGKLLGGLISILGIGIIALPSGIISAGLINEATKKDKNETIKNFDKFTKEIENKIIIIHKLVRNKFEFKFISKPTKEIWFKSNSTSMARILDYASWSVLYTPLLDDKRVFYSYINLTDTEPYLQLLMCKISNPNVFKNVEKYFNEKYGLVPSSIQINKIEGMDKIYSFDNNLGENRYCKIDLMTIPLDDNDNDEKKDIEEIIQILMDFENKIKEEPKIKKLKLIGNEIMENIP